MKSDESQYPAADQVLEDLGEKAVSAITRAVQRAKQDLVLYRSTFPQWVADSSERGLANWISDRIWARLIDLSGGVPDMVVIEAGPTREITVGGGAYRLRLKRHTGDADVASYPTLTFLDFCQQPNGQLPGLEEARLIAGYIWEKETREMGDAVVSLRDGRDKVIWQESLPVVDDGEEGDETGIVVIPQEPSPSTPSVEVRRDVGQKPEEDAGGK